MILGNEQRMIVALIRSEWMGFFFHPRSGHLIPAIVVGVIFAAWLYPVVPPQVAVVATLGLGLELQFMNCLSRSAGEFEALVLLPVRWRTILLGKNLAALLLSFFFLVIIMITVYQFYPGRISTGDWLEPIVMFATMAFPLLHIGNNRSIVFPRRTSGWCPEDLIESLWMLPTLGVLSLPYLIFIHLVELPWLAFPYIGVTGILWYRISLPRVAHRLTTEQCHRPDQ